MGDVAYTCGADWYPSTSNFGSDNHQPRCAWIDSDHSDKLRFIALSMHMPDFNGDQGAGQPIQRRTTPRCALCNSKARFMRWGQLSPDDEPPGYNEVSPMFSPPLQYEEDSSDKDIYRTLQAWESQ